MGTKISAATPVVTPAPTDMYATSQVGASKSTTRAQMHALQNGEHLVLPQVNEPATPTIAFGDGDSGFFEELDDRLGLALGGFVRFLFRTNRLSSVAGASLMNEVTSDTNPVLVPAITDDDTGIGSHSPDNLSIIAGGLEGARVEDPADLAATETSLWLFDFDNNTMEQVTIGAADSGGVGFKVLRIPN